MASEMVRIWHYAMTKPVSQLAFREFRERGSFHANIMAKALIDGVLEHSDETTRSKQSGRNMTVLRAGKNPVLLRMSSIKERNAARVLAAAKLLGTAYVEFNGAEFLLRPMPTTRALTVPPGMRANAIIAWAQGE